MVSQAVVLARRPHIIIATPGRLVDHLEHTRGFSLSALKYLVLDEADRMLGLDFEEEVRWIFFSLSIVTESLTYFNDIYYIIIITDQQAPRCDSAEEDDVAVLRHDDAESSEAAACVTRQPGQGCGEHEIRNPRSADTGVRILSRKV